MTTDPNNSAGVSIEERARRILATVDKVQLYKAIDPKLGCDIHPFIISDVILCIATIYAGYDRGRGITDIGKSILHTIEKLDQIFSTIRNILDRLDEVLRAIDAAVKLIERKIDRSFMQDHFASMRTATNDILEILEKLSKVALEQNNLENPLVRDWISQLTSARRRLAGAIAGFAQHDGGEIGAPPTVATIINCSSSVALWARSYSLADDYLPENLRTPVWDQQFHQDVKSLYSAFYQSTAQFVKDANDELNNSYLTPGRSYTVRFQEGRFVKTDIPLRDFYLGENEMYADLFCRREADPFAIYWTRPSYFGSERKWVWQRTPEAHEAVRWDREADKYRKPLYETLAVYEPVLSKQAEMMNAFEPPPLTAVPT